MKPKLNVKVTRETIFGTTVQVGHKTFERCTSQIFSGTGGGRFAGMFRQGFYWFYDGVQTPIQYYVLGDDGRYYAARKNKN